MIWRTILAVFVFVTWNALSQDTLVLLEPPADLTDQYVKAVQENKIETQITSLIDIGFFYETEGMYTLSEQYMRQALELSLGKKNLTHVGTILNSIGFLYRYQ